MLPTKKQDSIKLRTIQDDDAPGFIQLGKALHKIGAEAGYKETISDPETIVFCKFIIDYWPQFTIKQVLEAFDLAAARKLNIDAEMYGSFGKLYIGKVLDGFKQYNEQQYMRNAVAFVEQEEKPIPIEEKKKMAFDFIQSLIKRGEFPNAANWVLAYDYAYEQKIIDPSEDERDLFKTVVENELMQEISRLNACRMRSDANSLKKIFESPKLFKAECKMRWFKNWTEQQINQDEL